MRVEKLNIDGIPALLWGEPAPRLILSIHGLMGSKQDAAWLADVAVPLGYRVLSFDLPGHGDRMKDPAPLTPMQAAVEYMRMLACARSISRDVTLHAVSIGACFSLIHWQAERFTQVLLHSPLTDMVWFIQQTMARVGVSEAALHQAGEIPVPGAAPLYWDYYDYVRTHPVKTWPSPTAIIAGSEDEVMPVAVTEAFAARVHADMTVLPGSRHYLHTPEEMTALRSWAASRLTRD